MGEDITIESPFFEHNPAMVSTPFSSVYLTGSPETLLSMVKKKIKSPPGVWLNYHDNR
ncbi:MAG: hypothetical protein IPO24_20200 [Bacteroidetes bacterium]|nr:hypothetical protein [Bacteroidota bacterium]